MEKNNTIIVNWKKNNTIIVNWNKPIQSMLIGKKNDKSLLGKNQQWNHCKLGKNRIIVNRRTKPIQSLLIEKKTIQSLFIEKQTNDTIIVY